MNNLYCEGYDPDNVFSRFKLVEFPTSFVGLSSEIELDVDVDLKNSAYLKTLESGKLMKFEDAQKLSASHGAFNIEYLDKNNHTIKITFKPTNECISKAKANKHFENRFVFDLRLIRVNGVLCCNNEAHAEIGRFYISGQFEHCQINHYPQKIDFGNVVMKNVVSKSVYIKNDSSQVSGKMEFIRDTCLDVSPNIFTLGPNSTKKIKITIKPISFNIPKTFHFTIRNTNKESEQSDSNCLRFTIDFRVNIVYNKVPREILVESLHTLYEKRPDYTHVSGKEILIKEHNKNVAKKYFEISKTNHAKIKLKGRKTTDREDICCVHNYSQEARKNPRDFCKIVIPRITIYELFEVNLIPSCLDFGNVALLTYGETELNIENKSFYDISLKLLKDKNMLFTSKKLGNVAITVKAKQKISINILCFGFTEGLCKGTFFYSIDNKYTRGHNYKLQVDNPRLAIKERSLKFGMVTSEMFTMSVPIRIKNVYNVNVNFKWDEINFEIPFEILPASGSVPSHSYRICDVTYVSKPTKSKTHEIDFTSTSTISTTIPIEMNVITRKLAIKFLQAAVIFKDIPLNMETKEIVKLENSSREIAIFHILEPLIPGFTISPMFGIIKPKMIITFELTVKISCVIEFAFDIFLKVNNKENVILPVSGNVVEPKLVIHPKTIYMSRIPANMITYVPVSLQNLSTTKTFVQVIDTGDENIFDVYAPVGNEKQKISRFSLEIGQSKTVYIKVCDIYRREYDFYLPFQINDLLGPPTLDSWTTELQYYVRETEQLYENNPKLKIKTVNKDISYCRIIGVITVPWIHFSVDNFEIEHNAIEANTINFTMTNISRSFLPITILTSKLNPHFSLSLETEDNQSIINETQMKFELEQGKSAQLSLKFNCKGVGRHVATAIFYLDKHLTIPYYNLTFVGKKVIPTLSPSTLCVLFPPCHINQHLSRTITMSMEGRYDKNSFAYFSKEDSNITIDLLDAAYLEDKKRTELSITIEVSSNICCARNLTAYFQNENGASCSVEIYYYFTDCLLTLHVYNYVNIGTNSYPYYPTSTQKDFFDYMETSLQFLERWMFQQGFRRDLFPEIPETFHAISSSIASPGGMKSKGMNVSYLNFIKRITGPLMKHIHKVTSNMELQEQFRCVKEIYDTYKEITSLLKSRGSNIWSLQPKYLLSYNQFEIYNQNIPPVSEFDIYYTEKLLSDVELYNRLNKQCWFDFILQTYRAFVISSCFFECVCVNEKSRNIVKIIIDWYNSNIAAQHHHLRKNYPVKVVTNITSDLCDGIAIISTFLNNCPFLREHFSIMTEIGAEDDRQGCIVHNACLIMEAMNMLRINFPLTSKDLLNPNFMQMLFFSVHIYVVLPMFRPKETISFHPPLLRTSARLLAISPTNQEPVTFNFMVLNNNKNVFIVEKSTSGENGKKMYLTVKYVANYVQKETSILLVHGYNKTRIFDTYNIFLLEGEIGALNPIKKCRVTGPIYRPNKADIVVSSPFSVPTLFRLSLTDTEPTIPVIFEHDSKPRFYLRRLHLIDKEITLTATSAKESSTQEEIEQKVYFQIICLSTQVGNSWIWFRSEIGEFCVRVTTQPRWDLAIDTLQANVRSWPIDPCSCGEACECYRSSVVMIAHRNELMVKSLRYALQEYASEVMLQIFDKLIETITGKLILSKLLAEDGTNMSDVIHILREENTYLITSKGLLPKVTKATLAQHSNAMLAVPFMIPLLQKTEKYSIILTSECGMDIRTYKVFFVEVKGTCE